MTKPFLARLPILASALALAVLLAACNEAQQAAAPPDPAVTVAPAVRRTVVDRDEYVGRFVAVDSVDIRARVTGYLDQVHFTDGQMVKQGDLLFTIDRRPFQTALDQAKATLAQARANLAFAEADLARGAQLVRDKTITDQVFEQRTQAKAVAASAVAAQEAAVRQATLDLGFTELRAPIDGRIGDRRVSPGNLVSGNNILLATIVSLDPIRFEFTFDEAAYIRYERLAAGGKDMTSRNGSALVSLKLIDEQDFVHQGRMDFVDNVIDRSSGTIRGRAVFANPNHAFTPGMFGRIRVPGSPPYAALLVPDAAIGTEQARKYVLVVDADNTVRQKYVTLGELSGDLRVIKSGIDADDHVIVDGLMRARVGQKVRPQEQQRDGAVSAAPAAPAAGPQVKN
ncbi:MAG TPA: efflux RND transporter periplasmic adaptor subunit [Xanthobacteraceae bacterium]|nr:efflux RND transporter periplasmic adaptor subunit [Xanthobacteraceae bacterium]